MDEIVKGELKTTSKKAAASFVPWAVVALLFCCGGPIIILALLSGGTVGVFGFLTSSVFLLVFGILFLLLAIFALTTKIRKR